MARVTVADGTTISYHTFGNPDGEPLLLIMGLGVDRWGWLRQRSDFGKRFYCISPDNRGAGLSDKPQGAYDLEVMADDMLAVLDQEGIEKVHVMGASMGGAISQIFALKYPDRVHSLVLACTTCHVSDWRRELFAEWIDLLDNSGRVRFGRENIRWVLGARYQKRLLPLAPFIAPLAVRAPSHGVRGQIQGILGVSSLAADNLEKFSVPTFVITGSQDVLTPVADAEELALRIPDAELRVVPGAAHGFMVTKAKVFNKAVLDWHDRVAARVAS